MMQEIIATRDRLAKRADEIERMIKGLRAEWYKVSEWESELSKQIIYMSPKLREFWGLPPETH